MTEPESASCRPRPHSEFLRASVGDESRSPPPPAPLRHSYASELQRSPWGGADVALLCFQDTSSAGPSDPRMSVSTTSSPPSGLSDLAEVADEVADLADRPLLWTDDQVNWQQRCLQLQLSLQRFKQQTTKLVELQHRAGQSELRADQAERKARLLEQRLADVSWSASNSPDRMSIFRVSADGGDPTTNNLQDQIDEQRLIRLNEAKQVEDKAARIKQWVANKLRDLEEQNQFLREQNQRCNEQVELLKCRLNQLSEYRTKQRTSIEDSSRGSYEGDRLDSDESLPADPVSVSDALPAIYNKQQRPFVSCSAPPRVGIERKRFRSPSVSNSVLTRSSRDSRVDSGSVDLETPQDLSPRSPPPAPTPPPLQSPARPNPAPQPPTPPPRTRFPGAPSRPIIADQVNDYSEIYTPSSDEVPTWPRVRPSPSAPPAAAAVVSEDSRPLTPPLHLPLSWENKLYQLAQNGVSAPSTMTSPVIANGSGAHTSMTSHYSGVAVPVFAVVQGRVSQIGSSPLTGDSSDSSDGDEDVVSYGPLAGTAVGGSAVLRAGRRSHANSTSDETNTTYSGCSPSHGIFSPARQHRHDIQAEMQNSTDILLLPEVDLTNSLESSFCRAQHAADSLGKTKCLEKCGYLTKLGGKLKTWRKRWFVVKENKLMYWKSQHDAGRKASQCELQLDDQCRVSCQEGSHTFSVSSALRTVYLTSDNHNTVEEWVRLLQNVLQRNSARLLLSGGCCDPTIQGWLTRVKNGHSRRVWVRLVDKMIIYFRTPDDQTVCGQMDMRDCRVEAVSQISDSDDDTESPPHDRQLTIGVFPSHQCPSYLITCSKMDKDSWLYHLTVVSGGGSTAGTPFEQLMQRLMEHNGDPDSVLWKDPILLHSKDPPQNPLTSMSEELHSEANKLFKSCQLFSSVLVDPAAVDYHVALAQNAMHTSCCRPQLKDELLALLVKQTSPHAVSHKPNVPSKLLSATQSLFLCDSSGAGGDHDLPCSISRSCGACCPLPYTLLQAWQLLALAVSLFCPSSSRLLWFLKLHLRRHLLDNTETGKYAAYCHRALERTLKSGGRQAKPSRMEVLSILLKNPYHHSLPHAIPVHFHNDTYQVVGFDGSTSVCELVEKLNLEIGCRDVSQSGFALFSDDPIQPDLLHALPPDTKLCDVISRWETTLRDRGSGRVETTRVIQLLYGPRLYWSHATTAETDRERLLLAHSVNKSIIAAQYPLTRTLALELAALLCQIEYGDSSAVRTGRSLTSSAYHHQVDRSVERYYPPHYRNTLTPKQKRDLLESLVVKWSGLEGRSAADCVRVYLTCVKKWSHYGSSLYRATPTGGSAVDVYLSVSEDAISILQFQSLQETHRFPFESLVTFGGCQDGFMLIVSSASKTASSSVTERFIFHMSKSKTMELTLLMADYMNARDRQLQLLGTTAHSSWRTPPERTADSSADALRSGSVRSSSRHVDTL